MECDATTVRVRRRRRKRSRAAVPVLPEELILWEILVRLPAKPLLRCRAVCRSWRGVTSDAAFLLAHHRHQPSLPLVSSHAPLDRVYTGSGVHAAVDAFDLRRSPAERRPVLGFNDYNSTRQFTIRASCDGLLLLSLSNNRFYLCNPATRQWCELPYITGGHFVALYPHRPSGEYRVLYCKDPNHPKSTAVVNVYFVLTVGSSQGPRYIGMLMPSPSMNWATERGLLIYDNHPPILLHDCLHWDPGSVSGDAMDMVVFDTFVELFRWKRSPTAEGSAKLLEMDGRLGISHIDNATAVVKIWVLEDYEMGVWSLKYQIELPAVEMRRVAESKYLYATVLPENLNVLVYCQCHEYLFHCDGKGKLVEQFDSVMPGIIGLRFKESLVRHAFFQRRDGARARQPRFFRGL